MGSHRSTDLANTYNFTEFINALNLYSQKLKLCRCFAKYYESWCAYIYVVFKRTFKDKGLHVLSQNLGFNYTITLYQAIYIVRLLQLFGSVSGKMCLLKSIWTVWKSFSHYAVVVFWKNVVSWVRFSSNSVYNKEEQSHIDLELQDKLY